MILHPFMPDYELIIVGGLAVWVLVVVVCYFAAAGKISFFFFRNDSSAYLICGGIIGLASIAFVMVVSFQTDPQATQAWFGNQPSALHRFDKVKEYLNLVVTIFGAGISANLIASAITESRNPRSVDSHP